jgi:4-hydroxy-tetrahydrodipicolinate synthase
MLFQGVYVASITPFDRLGNVDWESLKSHLRFLSGAGVHGFVPCGTTGEGATLTPEEWSRVIEITVSIAKENSLKVIAGCGSNSTATVVKMVRASKELGADGVLVVTPYYNKPTPAGLLAHYLHIADQGGLPVVLYNVPGRTNICLTVETIAKLFEHDQIVGIKEASGLHGLWLSIAEKCDLKKKALLAGDDDAFATILSLGGVGIISATANVAPAKFVDLWNAAAKGNWALAQQIQRDLLPLVRAMFCETNPAPAKFALSISGKIANALRLPLVPIGKGGETQVREAVTRLGLQ